MQIFKVRVAPRKFHRLQPTAFCNLKPLDHSKEEIARLQILREFGDTQICPCLAAALETPHVTGDYSDKLPDGTDLAGIRKQGKRLQLIGATSFVLRCYGKSTLQGSELGLWVRSVYLHDLTPRCRFSSFDWHDKTIFPVDLQRAIKKLSALLRISVGKVWNELNDSGCLYNRNMRHLMAFYPFHGTMEVQMEYDESNSIPRTYKGHPELRKRWVWAEHPCFVPRRPGDNI